MEGGAGGSVRAAIQRPQGLAAFLVWPAHCSTGGVFCTVNQGEGRHTELMQ